MSAITAKTKGFRPSRYQLKIALSYMSILLLVLVLLNTYPVWLLQQFTFAGKHTAMSSAAALITGQLAQVDLSPERVVRAMELLEPSIVAADRVVVTNSEGLIIHDNAVADRRVGRYMANGDIAAALAGEGVFRCSYRNGVFVSTMAAPIHIHDEIFGALYLIQSDTAQGRMLADLQYNLFIMSIVIFLAGVFFSLFISVALTRRVSGMLHTIGLFHQGNYDYAMPVSGRDELTQVAGQLNKLAETLKKNEALRQQFVSNASHELKTPLAAVRLLTDSILHTPDMPAETVREFVADIGDETDRLSRMAENLLNLSRLENKTQGTGQADPAAVLERVAHMLRPLAATADVEIHMELSGRCMIEGSGDDLYQILYNLIDNGIKYNRPGGVVRVCCFRREDTVRIVVSDTGVGIPEEHQPHVFDRFYRVDKARSREAGGAGLGLSIVKGTAERMNGTVSVESEPGAGTRFTLVFPCAGRNNLGTEGCAG